MSKFFLILFTLSLTACATTSADKARQPAPKAISKAFPAYPLYAYSNGLSGYITFEYDIGTDGKVSEIRILESQPRYLFDDAIVKAVSTWRFETGHPYKNVQQKVHFRLRKPDGNL